MRKMKASGIEWIGEIPESWETTRHKYVMHKEKNICEHYNGEDIISLTMNGVIVRDLDAGGKMPTTFDGYQYVEPNKLLLCLFDIDVTPRCVGVIRNYGLTSPAYSKFVLHEGCHIEYYDYLLRAIDDDKVLVHLAKNLRSSFTETDFGALPTIAPPLPEQQAISAYLDRQCAHIDNIIEKTKASIEEYKKLRQAVITQAVTKGVRGDRPMKDSGIEWIGEIPEEWDVVRLKFILSEIVDCPHETPNYTFDGDYYVIRTADEDYGFLRSDDNMYRLNDDEYQNRIRRLSLDKDDIVYGREGERWGLACLVPDSNKYCLGQRMMQFRCKTDTVYPLYLKWALNSWSVYIQGCFDTLGSTSPHVNISTIINYYIPMPCYEEQIELAEYMESKSTAINALITKKETFLAELEAYKKSLIYEYVTGKKEVPQA